MMKADMDPRAAVRFWERMAGRADAPRPPEVISTHPADDRRLAELNAVVDAALAG